MYSTITLISTGPHLSLNTQLVRKPLFVLQQPALGVLQLFHDAPVILRLGGRRRRTMIFTVVWRPRSSFFVGGGPNAPGDGGTRNDNAHGLHLGAGFLVHFPQVKDARGRLCSPGAWPRRRHFYRQSLYRRLWAERRFGRLHAITRAADEHDGWG